MAGFVVAARCDQVPEGRGLAVEVQGVPLALFRVGQRFFALAASCSHEEAALADGRVGEDCTVECPLHGSRFDLATGRVLSLPAVKGVKSYPVRVVDGNVEAKVC